MPCAASCTADRSLTQPTRWPHEPGTAGAPPSWPAVPSAGNCSASCPRHTPCPAPTNSRPPSRYSDRQLPIPGTPQQPGTRHTTAAQARQQPQQRDCWWQQRGRSPRRPSPSPEMRSCRWSPTPPPTRWRSGDGAHGQPSGLATDAGPAADDAGGSSYDSRLADRHDDSIPRVTVIARRHSGLNPIQNRRAKIQSRARLDSSALYPHLRLNDTHVIYPRLWLTLWIS